LFEAVRTIFGKIITTIVSWREFLQFYNGSIAWSPSERGTTSMPDQSLVLGQLVEDFTARVRAGQLPNLEDYAQQHPELAERIRALFPTLLLLEGMVFPAPLIPRRGDPPARPHTPHRAYRPPNPLRQPVIGHGPEQGQLVRLRPRKAIS
jgi:hypothetical protein